MNKTKKGVYVPQKPQKDAGALNTKGKRTLFSLVKGFLCAIPERPLLVAGAFFAVLWLVLSFCEQALLFRVSDLSVFLFDDLYFDNMMSVPAGFLSYLGSFLVQFFHLPILGATIYVAMLVLMYWLTRKVFNIPKRYSLVALLPVAAVVASNSQLGYWIFYLKLPGYYYIALLGIIFSLLAIWTFRKLPLPARIPFVAVWVFFGYPLMGVYALAGAVVMVIYGLSLSVRQRKGVLLSCALMVLAFAAVYMVPRYYYGQYSTIALESVYKAGTPSSQWTSEYVAKVVHEEYSYWYNIKFFWIPFFMLIAFYLLLALVPVLKNILSKFRRLHVAASFSVLAVIPVFLSVHWFDDANYRIENKQNMAMWDEDWETVVELGNEAHEPTRQIVLNDNIALLNMGKAGDMMFENPHGSSDIKSPVGVHLTQTGGKMLYYYYGKLNFCYRWCVEDAVEYGWRLEYLKHATRSMILSGEYTIARRYINILKHTLFYSGWAEEMEKYIDSPELIAEEPSFRLPLQMSCYEDALTVDDSFVEAFLTKDLMVVPEDATPEYVEASLMMSLVRKDARSFWPLLDRYVRVCVPKNANNVPAKKLPKNYQEAYLVFKQLEKAKAPGDRLISLEGLSEGFEKYFIDPAIKQRFEGAFVSKIANINSMNNPFTRAFPDTVAVKDKKPVKAGEKYNASYFRYDFSDTYYYYFYFVRNIKTN